VGLWLGVLSADAVVAKFWKLGGSGQSRTPTVRFGSGGIKATGGEEVQTLSSCCVGRPSDVASFYHFVRLGAEKIAVTAVPFLLLLGKVWSMASETTVTWWQVSAIFNKQRSRGAITNYEGLNSEKFGGTCAYSFGV
jgi:hypothetical protein